MRCAWVPLPEPGAPSMTIRMMFSTRLRTAATLAATRDFRQTFAILPSVSTEHGSGGFVKKNVFYAQSGGVTAVINASACGVIETARKHKNKLGRVYAGR